MHESLNNQELMTAAAVAAEYAYAPYSGFQVGAALRTTGGQVITGCNVENASFGLTICAERVAFTAAIAGGFRDFDRIAIHVSGTNGQPCGACRQFMHELAPNLTVSYMRAGELITCPIGDLLPDAFQPGSLDA